MSALILWHNPRCSKSRAALALLHAEGLNPQVRLYLVDPPSAPEIVALAAKLGLPLLDMMRKGEAAFKAMGLGPASDDASLLAAMQAHPILIERPILIAGDRAAIGRPPEALRAVL